MNKPHLFKNRHDGMWNCAWSHIQTSREATLVMKAIDWCMAQNSPFNKRIKQHAQ